MQMEQVLARSGLGEVGPAIGSGAVPRHIGGLDYGMTETRLRDDGFRARGLDF